MAEWQPRVTPETKAALSRLGPYDVPHGGMLAWANTRGFGCPWWPLGLTFIAHPKAADADYRRLLDAWRQACGQQEKLRAVIRDAVRNKGMRASVFATDIAALDGIVDDQIRGCHFILTNAGVGQVKVEIEVGLAWDGEDFVRINLVTDDERLSWSFE